MAISKRRLALAAAACLLGCGAPTAAMSALRFYNREPIWRVDDRKAQVQPTERVTGTWHAYVDARVGTPVLRALEFRSPVAALDVNALGGVPDSTWFQNRIGVRDLTSQEIARGVGVAQPDLSTPLRVVQRLDATRLLVKDASGRDYELRFDVEGLPELETGADVVVSRLLWAAGYNVPANMLACLRADDLAPAPDNQADVAAVLARAPKSAAGGCYRAVMTDQVPGQPIDAFAQHGVRSDDANDRVPHERRRSLRGAAVFFAWVGDTDMQDKNTLDVWVEAPPGSQRGYLVHYLRDFGKAFGARGLSQQHEHDGFSPHFDLRYAVPSLFSLGLWERPFEPVTAPGLVGVGRYEVAHFAPGRWSPEESYRPFSAMDRLDAYWAATILARFSAEQVAVAVDQGRYTDPATRTYLIRTLLARRRMLLAHAFSRVTPLDRFVLTPSAAGFRLCAVDLMLAHALETSASTHYMARAYDEFGRSFDGWRELDATDFGSLCVDGIEPSAAADGYTMLSLTTWRHGHELPAVIVHLALVPRTQVLRIVGIERR